MLTSDRLERLKNLSPAKRALLLKQLQEKAAPTEEFNLIPRRAQQNPAPLSFAQQRLWFLNRLEPDSAAYNVPVALRLTGQLDAAALERTLNEVARRHEVLRTTFSETDGQPMQIVAPFEPQPLPVTDLSNLPADERDAEVQRRAADERQRPFDLARGPLLRASLVRLAEEEHALLVTMHHIVSDGWSTGVLIRELTALYSAFARGEESPLPELPVQYADYAVWQRERLSGETLEQQLTYWKEQLTGAPALLTLPTDRPRPAVQSYRGATLPFTLSAELTERLHELTRRHDATLFMTLLAGWQALLSRYSGQEDICVGADIANRTRRETEDLIGFFVNMLVLRTHTGDAPTFRELLARARQVCLGAYAHQEVPFEKLVEELAPERSLGHQPLFQVVFALQNAPRGSLRLPGLELASLGREITTAKFDLVLNMWEVGGALAGALEYSTDLFDAATAERMTTHFSRLLAAVAANEDVSIGDIALLSDEEEHAFFDEAAAQESAAETTTLTRLFARQVELTPDAPAVEGAGGRLTYAQLNERVETLARRLRALGVGPESRVGLLLERSVELVVAVLGVLRAGGAYVPLDPEYPRARLAFIMEDAGGRVLLTQTSLRDSLPETAARVLCVDERRAADADEAGGEPAARVAEGTLAEGTLAEGALEEGALAEGAWAESAWVEASPANLCYVIYTSGSTGTPKGVGITHASAAAYVQWAATAYSAGAPARMALYSSVAFDLTVTSLWLPLLTGGSVVACPGAAVEALEAAVASGAQLLKLTPSHLRLLVGRDLQGTGVRRLILGGEGLPTELAREAVAAFGEALDVCNEYGPTEATVGCMLYKFDPTNDRRAEVPIGRGRAGARVYVLDGRQRPAAEGVRGELYVGGECLARGYVGRAGLTAERFVPDPYAPEPGARMYRTGDAARRLAGGEVEYLGRLDSQVKVRGVRLELGEVRAALNRHGQVRDSYAVVRPGAGGMAALVCYYAARQAVEAEELRRHMGGELPAEAQPAGYVWVRRLPLTLNGKVNEAALPEWRAGEGSGGREHVAARTETERTLCGAWREVLGIERVGVEDNFFELGGHSLLATQVISRVRSEFGVELALKELFEHPTVEALARRVEEAGRIEEAGRGAEAPGLRRLAPGEPKPLSFAQQRLWFIDRLEPGSSAYNIPAALRLSGDLNVAALEQTFSALVRRHETLRTRFVEGGRTPLQEVMPALPVALPVIDLSSEIPGERESAARRLIEEEGRRPFDLATGPVYRAMLLRLGDKEHVLLVTMHHIVSDGWSVGVLIRELSAFYEAFSRGEELPLKELPIQYADYAAWQREYLSGETLERQLAYWREQLTGAPALLTVPTDRPRPAVQSYRGATLPLSLPEELTERLQELSRAHGCTLFMTLLAGWQALLSRYSGQEDVVVGTPIAGRTQRETEDLIGFFVNTLALRTDLSGDPSFEELLGRVRETTLGAYAHQDVPFEKLVEELAPERSLSHQPVFQVVLSLQNTPRESLRLHGLELSAYPGRGTTAKFDLVLSLIEGERGLAGGLEYSTDLFDEATAARLLRHYVRMLEAVVADPASKVHDAQLLGAEEEREFLEGLKPALHEGAPEAYAVVPATLTRLFARQVELTPDAPAVEDAGGRLTYAQLNERVETLARRLRALGVVPESRVGLLLERSVELVVAVLGVLRAGGAYVPLDPEYPRARLAFIMEDAGAAVLLTQTALLDSLPETAARVLCVDERRAFDADEAGGEPAARVAEGASEEGVLEEGAWAEGESEESAWAEASPANLCYVIYTSGSTGTPKGVGITHASAAAYVQWAATAYSAGAPARMALYSSVAFDLTVTSLWLPLLTGGSVVACPGAAVEALEAAVASGAQLLKLTPSHLRLLVGRDLQGTGVRRLILGGEGLPTELARQAVAAFGEALDVCNEYGPTEATVGCMLYKFDPDTDRRAEVPIGRGRAGARVYVLDGRQRPAAEGVRGELYVGGECLARGYVGRAGLTAERFVPDPYAPEPGARMYRTGDAARRLAGGEVEYLGRLDSQVKVRGVRLELGEVRAALNRHGQVRDSYAVVRPGAGGMAALVCYYAARQAVEAEELRRHMGGELPAEAQPAGYVWVRRLPLTLNGKVNEAALPAYEPGGAEARTAYEEPRNATEELLCAIWSEVLGIARVGVGDNFFELGGHSLLATQVVSRVREAFEIELPLRRLFDAPTVASLAAVLDELKGERDGEAARAISHEKREGSLPLSFAQQRLWFLDQLEPGSSTYNVPAALRLTGHLDVVALERTLSEVARRHESLRTTFAEVGGVPVQVVAPFAPRPLPLTDLSELPDDEREAEVQRLTDRERQQPFDLAQGTLLRTSLVRLAEEEHVLLVTMHHIISDGWSVGVLIRELTALYAAYARGEESPLEELPIQYADYAAWQREYLSGETLERQLTYWRERLTGAPALLTVLTDRPRPAVQSFRGATHHFSLPAALTERLRELSRRHEVTLFMTLLAGWQALLSRYAGQEDVVVGTPIAGRTRRETEDLIGFFTNTLALRTDLSGDPSFEELLRRVRETTLGAYAHQDVPFERLVEELAPERSLSHQPVFQVAFALQNAPRGSLRLPGLELAALPGRGVTAKFDLALNLAESEGGLSGALEYSTDLFDEATAARLLRHYARVLEAVAADPSSQVSEARLLDAEEEQLLTHGWNATRRDYERDAGLAQLFRRQVQATPEAVAIVCGDERVTYAELDARATDVAGRLRAVGVGTETRVAVMLERSTELVAALLGVVKAGGTYVPLDPDYPQARLAFMLEDTGAPVVLTQTALLGSLPETAAHVLRMDEWRESDAAGAGEPEVAESKGDNLAYVMYTSGSTGRPKGVCITHRGVLRLVCNTDYVVLGPDDVVAQASNACFDAITFEIWGALLAGACLSIIPRDALLDPNAFAASIVGAGISTLSVTTALFNLMAAEAPAALGAVKHLLFGGEACDPSAVRSLLRAGAPPRLLQLYGPTETTTFATWHPVREVGERASTIPIGRPIANTQIYILDQLLRPVPVGVAGELYIGGDGLARGYLNAPDMTAARFVPNPFADDPGARLYRTGDQVRYLPDATVEFLGRADQQVKLRGFRIELGEVEVAVTTYPGVGEAVVVAQDAGAAGKRLIAYYTTAGGAVVDERELRAHVERKLPGYMVPAGWVALDALPLTNNGKVDRRALPEFEATSGSEYVAPRTEVEQQLCAIWGEVLRAERVGIDDNFFEMGGHSLLATQVVSRVREAFEVELPLRRFFESPTVAGLAAALETPEASAQGVAPAAIGQVGRGQQPPPLSFAQQRLWFLDQLEPGSSAYNVPTALRLTGHLDVTALERTINEVMRRHDSLRTTFAKVDGEPAQVVVPFAWRVLPITDLSGLAEDERETEARRLAEAEQQLPFDLAAGPVCRASLVRLAAEEHVLLVTMHHIISDGWSVGVLVRELTALYAAYTRGEESPLEELSIQYADYARWQREHLSGARFDAQLDYWKERLTGAPALLTLPTDRPRPAVQTSRGSTTSLVLSAELMAELRRVGQAHGCTLFMTLLAGWQALLSRYAGQEDIVVGTPIAGRTQRETEGLIGFFVNTLALRTDVSGDPSFEELLGRVRETTLGAYAHQDMPFERLVEELSPERSLSHQPVFQVMFTFQNAPRDRMNLEGVTLTPMRVGAKTSQFDLTLGVAESQDKTTATLEYNTDLFDGSSVERMLSHYRRVLEQVVKDENAPLSALPLVMDDERRRMLYEWNDTAREFATQPVHRLFEQQAARSPQFVAVEHGEERLTYGELNARADCLALALRERGIGRESRVGVCVGLSPWMLVALLGVLKSGAAYVPLDPEYPAERLAYMVEDAGIALLLTEPGYTKKLPDGVAGIMVESLASASEGRVCPQLPIAADNAAYVIYTSGSTGRPKGVLIQHGALSNYTAAAVEAFGLRPGEKVLQFASISFDAAAEEIFPTLTAGATLVLRDERMLDSPRTFLEKTREGGITVLHLPTAYWHHLTHELATTPAKLPESVRLVNIGGEEAVPEHLAEWYGVAGDGVRLVNTYGPTEATIVATMCDLTTAPAGREAHPKAYIGSPVPNVRSYVLDARLQPTPVGVPGELYIGGTGVARGYLNRPALTAERFIPDPFGESAGGRLYRTGDRARYLLDGRLEFLGRVDQQVKIRGFRVELGEIEAALRAYPSVRESIVLAREATPGDLQLAAYLLREPRHAAPSPAELRNFLQQRVPGYMVPAAFVVLDEWPLLPNGKIDRRALPAPETPSAAEPVGARTPFEEIIAGIWREVLRREVVGVEDNFFELGGHSLLATQVVSRIREALGIDIPLKALFEHTTVAALATHVESLLAAGETLAPPPPPITRAPRDGRMPLSFAQQRLWFIDRLEPGASAYNIPAALRLTGHLDVDALGRAFAEMVRRHESLRTTFAEIGGVPVQVVAEAAATELPVLDLRDAPGGAEHEARRLAAEEARQPFDLAQGPLLRVALLRLAEEEHVLLATMHHIISDGWSVGVLIRELTALYAAYTRGEESPLAELPIQYADYAVWQREHLSGARLDAQLDYWKERLTGAPALLTLPTDRPRPAVQSYRGATLPFSLAPDLTARLHELSRAHGCTLFMTLLAGWQTLLSRYAGQEDIVVGTPIAGRTQRETEGLIGFFVNTLALRTDLSGDPSFAELLRRVRETTLGAYAHQDVPFEKLVEELQPDRDMSRSPLFQVMFVLQNAPSEALQLEGLTLRGVENAGETAKFELTLGLEERRGEIVGGVDYNRDLYEAKTVARMVEGYKRVLRAAVEEAARRVLQIELLSEQERRQIVAQWNETGREYGGVETVQEMFAEQAERNGEAVAVVYEGREVSYGELNRRANRLAHYLRAQGVQPDDVVGVLMQRSVDMVVALLGILKAGGAYLPLDPAYPRERLAFMVGDARLRWLISHQPAEAALPELLSNSAPLNLLRLDAEWAAVASQPDTALDVRPAPDNLAYVIYTSGSTGRPKGVMISHRAIGNHMRWMQASFPLGTGDAVLQKTPFSFDASVWEFYAPLLAGARLVVARPGGHQEAAYLVEVMERENVTRLQVVPTLLRMLMGEPGLERCERLREVFSGGEVLTRELAERFLSLSGERRLYNLYGPTEATIDATWQEVERGRVEAGEEVGIGRGIANTQLYVLDAEMAVVPVGVVGELYIGGVGLGRGYLNRPELTAEKFVPNPFSAGGGERLYRTGDMVRWREGGELAYVGRVDAQVKVRGFRIELGEIEAALLAHAGIGEAAVVAHEVADGGSTHLVAYYVTAAGAAGTGVAELRAHLAERLPEHMMPSYFMRMEALPLTPNGKLDRRALPAPEASSGREYVAPRSGSEEALCAIWREVLRVEQVGVHDNFFELGGHSLLATQVVSRVREVFAVELPLRRLFESPTVAGLAAVLDAMMAEPSLQGAASLPAIAPGTRDDYPPLSFAQQRLWFLDRLEPGSSTYNVPAALRLTGHLDVDALSRAIAEMVRRHESLRTTFAEIGGVPVQVVAEAAATELPVLDLRDAPGGAEPEARRLAAEEARQPFDLAQGPLLRVVLLRLGEEEHVLLATMHHIISDGWSVGVLVHELTALYAAYTRGEESPLAELPIQYADYAVWQREHLSGARLDAQLTYWRERLTGAPALLALPTDRPRPVVQSYHGASASIRLPQNLVTDLRRVGQSHGCTLFMTLLAGWQALLSRYAGQEDIVVGTPIAGRTQRETEGLIGFFVNTLALRTDLSGEPSFEELLRRVREATLGAYAHQDLPFERLVEELSPERSLAHQPVFQVMFVLRNASRERVELGEVVVGAFGGGEDESEKFDMTLGLNEEGGGSVGGSLSYNTELFDAATAERMAAHYVALMAGMAARPAEPVSAVPLLGEDERRRLEAVWNATDSGWTRDQTIPKLFEAQAEATPEAVALIDGATRISYAELNARAEALARRLRARGVVPESRVGIFTARSTEMVVALLGTLKAGGAYVPLDHTYPQERLSFMMGDAGLSLVLTQESVRASLPSSECAVLSLDGHEHAALDVEAEAGDDGDAREALAENLAYIIYTSGSTGRPKGVAITHGSAAILIEWTRRLFTPDQLAGVLASTSVCFDLSVFELFATLCCGGSVILAENALALHALPAAADVTLVNTVPSVMAELLRGGSLPENVRVVNLAGEPLPMSLAQRVWAEPGVERLYNLYGPTEDTTYSTWAAVGADETRAPVIGRPLPDTRAYIFDAKMRPVPVGVAGELYLAGEGLARGYHGRPGLTAERFIPDPFSEQPGGRLYRTGDLARRLTNGDLDLVGRADYQVKIRGFRIELGEVETAVASHPAVGEVAVVAVEAQESLRLVCYYTARNGLEATTQELRAHVERRLPGYMMPSAFAELPALPLTPNGKVDRRALAALGVEAPVGGTAYEAPRTPVEELLCAIWEEVLGVERVGVHDNFFELGGHSLLATQVVSRCRELLECDVPLRTLFESPTVADLAEALLALSGEDEEEEEDVANEDVEASHAPS